MGVEGGEREKGETNMAKHACLWDSDKVCDSPKQPHGGPAGL